MMKKPSPNYLALIDRFPLRPITCSDENAEALKVIVELTHRENNDELSEDEVAYFILLSKLVKEFERTRVQPAPNATPQDILLFLLETHGLKQIDLASKLDIPKTHISSFLSDTRALTKDEVGRIAAHFGLNPLLLLPTDYFASRKRRKKLL